MLPGAADTYRRQIAKGLEGDDREALKARIFLREAFGGAIRLRPEDDGGLTAHWNECSAALLGAAGGCRPIGSGGHATTLEVTENEGHPYSVTLHARNRARSAREQRDSRRSVNPV